MDLKLKLKAAVIMVGPVKGPAAVNFVMGNLKYSGQEAVHLRYCRWVFYNQRCCGMMCEHR